MIQRHTAQNDVALIGVLLLSFPIYTYLIATIAFACGCSVQSWFVPLAFVASIITTLIFTPSRNMLHSAVCISMTAIQLCLLSFVLNFFDDYSFDGNFYHQEIICYITEGWNPWSLLVPGEYHSPWAMHYPKGMEIILACIVKTTGYIETGKIINFMLAIGTGSLLYDFLCKVFPTLKNKRIAAITVIAMLNPVCVSQMLTYYVDFAVYCIAIIRSA